MEFIHPQYYSEHYTIDQIEKARIYFVDYIRTSIDIEKSIVSLQQKAQILIYKITDDSENDFNGVNIFKLLCREQNWDILNACINEMNTDANINLILNIKRLPNSISIYIDKQFV